MPGQYSNLTVHKCQVCDSNCKTCLGLATNCTTCYLNNGQYVFLENNICVQKCADGWYGEFFNFTCMGCHGGCRTCNGPALTDCDFCTVFNSTNYYKDRNSRTCNTTCPVGQFIKASVPYICQACDAQCIACTTSSSFCIESYGCAINYYYHFPTNECLLVCPNSYWPDKAVSQDCIACESGCSLCHGAGYGACTRCKIDNASVPYYKVRYIDNCTTDCPPGDYEIFASF